MKQIKLFTYGTLQPDFGNSQIFTKYGDFFQVKQLGHGWVTGASLYKSNPKTPFPFIHLDNSTHKVRGFVYQADEDILEFTNMIEGHIPESSSNYYELGKVNVKMESDNKTIKKCLVYHVTCEQLKFCVHLQSGVFEC